MWKLFTASEYIKIPLMDRLSQRDWRLSLYKQLSLVVENEK